MEKTLLVLAAGMGSRYGGLKQIDPIGPNGEIIIDYSIYDAIRAGFTKVIFVIRKDIEDEFRENIGNRFKGKVEVEYAFQELENIPSGFKAVDRSKPWGTGHAVLAAKELIEGPFAVINADDFYGAHGYKLLSDFFDTNSDRNNCSMVGFKLKKTLSENGYVSRGVCQTSSDGLLQTVVEMTNIEKESGFIVAKDGDSKTKLTGDEIVSMNMWGLYPETLTLLEEEFKKFLGDGGAKSPTAEFYLPFAIDNMIKEEIGSVSVLKSQNEWYGVTYKEDKPSVVKSIQSLVDNNVYPSQLN